MIQPFMRGDIRRCLTAGGLPAIALLALVRIRLSLVVAGDRPTASSLTSGLRVAVTATIVLATVWFVIVTNRALTTPRRDAHAADRLNQLRERATWPGHSLWEIQSIERASAAGQRTVCVDVLTGEVQLLWLERACLDRGTFVLLAVEYGRHRLIAWLDPETVASAGRHQSREDVRTNRRSAEMDRTSERLRRNEADRVIQAAEKLLRGL